MEIIKVSFEPTDAWNREEFRQLIYNIKHKFYDNCNVEFELWIISTNENPLYINTIASQLDIPSNKVILCTDDTTKVGQIVLNTNIHFDTEQVIIDPLDGKVVWGVLVDRKLDYQKLGLKYISNFGRFSEIILKERAQINGIPQKNC